MSLKKVNFLDRQFLNANLIQISDFWRNPKCKVDKKGSTCKRFQSFQSSKSPSRHIHQKTKIWNIKTLFYNWRHSTLLSLLLVSVNFVIFCEHIFKFDQLRFEQLKLKLFLDHDELKSILKRLLTSVLNFIFS